MGEKELRRSLAVFPIGTVMKLTDLSARQIRYYEEQRLVIPERSETNRRMYSLNDVDRLLEIKDYLADGLTIMAIQKIFNKNNKNKGSPKWIAFCLVVIANCKYWINYLKKSIDTKFDYCYNLL